MGISEYKELFLSEAQEILSSQNKVLVELEKKPGDLSLLHELFRLSHTLKSMAQTMGYDNISKLTHSLESALALLKSNVIKSDINIVNLMFQSLDILSNLVEGVKKGKTKQIDISPLVEKIDLLTPENPLQKASLFKEREPQPGSDDIEKDISEKIRKESDAPAFFSETQSVRIPLTRLDSLMEIMGELIINGNRISQISRGLEYDVLSEAVAQLSVLTSAMQNQMMEIRLISLEYLFTPYYRLVRDMAATQKKEIDLIIEGSNIGLDRSVQDEINEPLLHILKNAVIHGIEKPEVREKIGKARRGTIKITARREKNVIIIEISDDGSGMDIKEIKETAIVTGLITKDEISKLTPEEVLMLITYPGYSKAESITESAGRGIGLNASRKKVEYLGGSLNINTKSNEGTTISLELPLSMTIIQAMLVGIEDGTYCIPLSHIAEAIKMPKLEIKSVEHQEIISYRDSVIPLIRLREKFGFPPSNGQSEIHDEGEKDTTIPIVIVEVGSKKVGLIVDRFIGQQDTVIKSLTGALTDLNNTSGATILGSGDVALIVDVPSLI